MKNKFLIKIVMLVAMAAISQTAMSQKVGFAGGDQEVMISDGVCFLVKLGVPVSPDMQSDNTTVYFHWRIIEHPDGDEGILDDDGIAQPTLTVSKCGVFVCECIRISKYGYQTEYVTVNVVEEVEIVSIECDKACYAVGQEIDVSDFAIETNPPGYADNVELQDDNTIAKRTSFSYGPATDEVVSFKVRRDDGTTYTPENNKATINVVDNSKNFYAFELPIGKTFHERLKALSDVDKLIDDVQKTMRENKLFRGKMPDKIITFDLNFSVACSEDCCDYKEKSIAVIDLSLAVKAGYHVYIPVFTFVGFDIGFTCEGSYKVGGARLGDLPIPENQCSSVGNMSYTSTVNIFGKVMATLVPPTDTFSISGGLKGYFKLVGDFIPEPTSTCSIGLSATLDIVAMVTIYSGEWNIWEGGPWQIVP